MVFTSEEIAMIDGIIETLFSGANVSADVRDAYLLVHRHLTEDALEVKDFKRIGIAHPDFREQLIADAEKMHIWRRSNK